MESPRLYPGNHAFEFQPKVKDYLCTWCGMSISGATYFKKCPDVQIRDVIAVHEQKIEIPAGLEAANG